MGTIYPLRYPYPGDPQPVIDEPAFDDDDTQPAPPLPVSAYTPTAPRPMYNTSPAFEAEIAARRERIRATAQLGRERLVERDRHEAEVEDAVRAMDAEIGFRIEAEIAAQSSTGFRRWLAARLHAVADRLAS